jgi:hypothetical protein
MNQIPHEIAIGGIYMPPLFVAALMGIVLAIIAAKILNKYRLSKYFFYPPLVFVAMVVIFTVLVENILFMF